MSRHSSGTNHTSIEGQQLRAGAPVLACHLALVVHADGLLSWHFARMDLASRRMVFPYAGVTEAPGNVHPSPVDCLIRAANHLMEVEKAEFQ